MNIKMICSDLDETLLNDQSVLSEKTAAVLQKAMAENIFFVPVTGRHFFGIPQCVLSLPGLRFAVSSNGAQIWDLAKRKKLFSAYFEKQSLEFLMDLANQAESPFEIYQRDTMLMNTNFYEKLKRNPGSRAYLLNIFGDKASVPDVKAHIEKDPYCVHKFLIRDLSPAKYYELHEKVNNSGLAEAATSIEGIMEISPVGINKGSALIYLCDLLNILPEQTVAFGDGVNDIPMFQTAGISVAVRNAPESVKEAADYITGSYIDGGPADYIEKYILQNTTEKEKNWM